MMCGFEMAFNVCCQLHVVFDTLFSLIIMCFFFLNALSEICAYIDRVE